MIHIDDFSWVCLTDPGQLQSQKAAQREFECHWIDDTFVSEWANLLYTLYAYMQYVQALNIVSNWQSTSRTKFDSVFNISSQWLKVAQAALHDNTHDLTADWCKHPYKDCTNICGLLPKHWFSLHTSHPYTVLQHGYSLRQLALCMRYHQATSLPTYWDSFLQRFYHYLINAQIVGSTWELSSSPTDPCISWLKDFWSTSQVLNWNLVLQKSSTIDMP